MIFESVVRDKWPLDSMSEISCRGEITPRPRIEPATPELQIQSDALSIELSRRANIKSVAALFVYIFECDWQLFPANLLLFSYITEILKIFINLLETQTAKKHHCQQAHPKQHCRT